MTDQELKDRLLTVLETLPAEKVEAVLEYANSLQQAQSNPPAGNGELDDWDRAIIAAEEYWFGLPETTRRSYIGKTAAVVEGQILDADRDVAALEERVVRQYPDVPVLYIEGETRQFEPLLVRSPRLI